MKEPTPREQSERLRRSLRAVPFRNASARVFQGPSEGELRVEVDLVYRGFFMKALRSLFDLRRTKSYVLDRIGSAFYLSIDGKKDLERLSDEFAAREKLSFFEARALVGQYLQTLTKKGLVVAALPKN